MARECLCVGIVNLAIALHQGQAAQGLQLWVSAPTPICGLVDRVAREAVLRHSPPHRLCLGCILCR